jgi:hypothetical protein
VSAVVAGLDMTTQRGGAAVLDGRHDLELAKAERPGVGRPIGRPGSTEDIGDLERGVHRLSREAAPPNREHPKRSRGLTTAFTVRVATLVKALSFAAGNTRDGTLAANRV